MSDTIEDTITVPVAASTGNATTLTANISIHLPPAASPPTKVAAVGVKPAKLPKPSRDIVPGLDFSSLMIAAPEIKPEYYYDAAGITKFTRYTDSSGATAVLRQDPTDHNKVTLTLSDKNGVLETHGNERGFVVRGPAPQGTEAWPIVRDTLSCGGAKKDIVTNETESVTRDKLQQFAEAHPQLAAVLRKVELPVTVTGGLPVSFAKAVDTPSEFRACPENRSGILLERITEKSAKR